MNEIQYIGEHLWIGQLGHFALVLGFVAALFSAYTYYQARHDNDPSWTKMGRWGFGIHGVCTLLAMVLIFYAMLNQMYEYAYVQRTVAAGSQLKYMLAAFWADQEGSFLLWMFWHVVLGAVLIRKKKWWEPSVLVSLALIEAFIASMLIGLYLPISEEDFKIGSNPFILLREAFDAPIFANADYLTLVEGKGLNPLLQNYWMTIHPPVVFLGFASVSIPFCFSITALSLNKHKELLNVILKWALFSAAILGLGILMGGAWAYEALSFGGYWAWDPVENTSLVPWLLLVAGVHTNLIAKSTGYSIRTTHLYYLLSLILIIYSTFLTRSGVLGDTSVHAFTTMGLEAQLSAFILFFIGLAAYKYVRHARHIPKKETEESIYTREFWMFIGSLVLFFSGLLMTLATSLPLYNKLVEVFDPNHVGLAIDNPVSHHNRYQIWIGIFMGLLTGASIMLRYGTFNWEKYKMKYLRHTGASLGIALLATLAIQFSLNITAWPQYLFLFAGIFTITSNFAYLQFFIQRNLKLSGSVVSHVGFGLLILGIMYSGLNKKIISTNPFAQRDIVTSEDEDRAVILIKNEPFFATDYWINYEGDTLIDNLRKYKLNFRKVNKENETIDEFVTYPSALYKRDFSKIEALNPGNERRLTYDVFTASAPPPHMQDIETAKALEDSLHYLSFLVKPGETIDEETYTAQFGQIQFNGPISDSQHGDTTDYELTMGLPIKITAKRSGNEYNVSAGLGVKDGLIFQFPRVIDELGIKIKVPEEMFNRIFTQESNLRYDEIVLREGEDVDWNGYTIRLNGFDRNVDNDQYIPEENDIALGGNLTLTDGSGMTYAVSPIFVIRDNQQFSIKDYNPESGIHARFTRVDPSTEQMTFRLARDLRNDNELELLIASEVPRSDILIVEAKIFPGINLVWLGCLMMLAGLTISLWAKRSSPTAE